MIDSDVLEDRMYNSMTEFSKALNGLAGYIEGDASRVVRKIIIDVYTGITLRSPVDTGYYRASHSIAVGDGEPDATAGLSGAISTKSKGSRKGNYGVTKSNPEANATNRETISNFNTWEFRDGPIWIFNNVPYAEVIERGHSQQAPNGVYTEALNELTTKLNDVLDTE